MPLEQQPTVIKHGCPAMLLKSIKIKGLLSFKDVELEMRPLNVLVGANASGKSNLIEIMALLQAVPRDLAGFFWRSGGVGDWLYRGEELDSGTVEAIVTGADGTMPLRYALTVGSRNGRFQIVEEGLDNPNTGNSYRKQPGDSPSDQSLLRQELGGEPGPEITNLQRQLDAIRLYRNWNLGHSSPARHLRPAAAPADFLAEDLSNLAVVLKGLAAREEMRATLDDRLRWFEQLNENLGFHTCDDGIQLWIRESGLLAEISAPRLSNGTLRLLALLAILCHPNPPPLVCIEEPELGLNPDVVHMVAKLLLAAAERTQLVITTHSPDLLDQLWENPEDVVALDKFPNAGTRLTRLEHKLTREFLDKRDESFGELWLAGHFGGVWP